MGLLNLFGSDSSTSQQTTTQETGFSNVGGNASSASIQGNANQVTIRPTDQGAIAAAEQIAQTSLASVDQAGANTKATVASAINAVNAANQSQIQSVMKDVMVAGIVGLIVWGIRGVFHK